MEATPALPAGADDWAARFAAALGAQRERIRVFLAAQQARLSRTEAQLRDQGRALKELLQREARQVEQARQTLEDRRAELDRREAELERLSSQLSVQREQWEDLCRQTAAQNTALGEQWRRQQAEWFSQLAEQQAALDAQWRSRQAAFEEQCRIEQENWHQLRSRQQAELESVREELERRRAELDRQRAELERQRAEWERQRTDWETRRLEAADDDAHRIEEVQERFDAIRRDALAAALTEEAPAPPRGEPSAVPADGQAEDYRRRYEMALEDLRQIRARNAELQQEVAQLRSSSGGTEGVLNWELEKQKILAALEAEAQRESISPEERIEVRQIVARTDQLLAEKDRLLAEKDREIEELKVLLENQSGNLGSVAVGAAALGEMFDHDAVIQEHRAHLEQLQAELQEKMRQAEIEISLERAKLARERAKLEEQMRALPPVAEPPAGEKPDRTGRGRWRAQLGIGGEQPAP